MIMLRSQNDKRSTTANTIHATAKKRIVVMTRYCLHLNLSFTDCACNRSAHACKYSYKSESGSFTVIL